MKLPNLFEKDAVPTPYAAGQVIFEEGQSRDFMYVINKGEVDILIRGHVVETVGEDGFFGELALIDPAPRSAAAIAKTPAAPSAEQTASNALRRHATVPIATTCDQSQPARV